MVVLTDGEDNASQIVDPLTAADLATTYGIRIYTIGAGKQGGIAPVPVVGADGRVRIQRTRVNIDEATLREIADRTGGRYFNAEDGAALESVYAQIDELERSRIDEQRFYDYGEMAIQSTRVAGVTWPPLLTVVLTLLIGEMALRATRFRRLV